MIDLPASVRLFTAGCVNRIRGRKCGRPVSLVDLYPTLIELCDLPSKDDLDGESLVPLLADVDAPGDRPAISTFGHGNHSIATERWQYIRYFDSSEELYDHNKDPEEWSNVANDPRFKEIKTELARHIPRNPTPLKQTSQKLSLHHFPPFRSRAEYKDWLEHGKDTRYLIETYWQHE